MRAGLDFARFDFVGLLRAALAPQALGGLGLRPHQFWALTPIEVQLMLGREAGGALMSRARLEELAAAYPDGKGPKDDASAGFTGADRRAGGFGRPSFGGDVCL